MANDSTTARPTPPSTSGASPQQLPSTWDTVAPTYAESVAQWGAYAEEALRLVSLGPKDRVLDIATGPGTLAVRASARAAHVTASDFSPGMIEELKREVAKQRLANVEALVADAQALPVPDASFDAAFCMFGFFFFPDRARAFAEMHRALRPGGRALIATWAPIAQRPLMQIGFEAMAEALPQVPLPAKGDLQSEEDCVREMSAAGFRDVATSLFTQSVRIDSAAHYLELVVKATAPCALMRKKLGEEAFEATMQRVLPHLEKRIPPGGRTLTAQAIFTTAVR